jgi:hypothetical protein
VNPPHRTAPSAAAVVIIALNAVLIWHTFT